MLARAVRAADRPLDPSPDEARDLVRRELVRPEYHDRDVVARLLDWLEHQLDRVVDAASAAPPVATLAAMLVLLVLVGALGWLLTRARRSGPRRRGEAPVLTAEQVSADELRRRAEAALAAGRHEEAVLEAFRAIALSQVERGELSPAPGRTAHEVAEALAAARPPLAARARDAGLLFDRVRYGERPADAAQAAAVLALDADLAQAGVR
nr:DUF4129 domain-containing protein [Nocardioides sp. zg-DK7169]